MEEKVDFVQRMYCITLYNISPIQQGIQSLHAVVEYQRKYGNDAEYKGWADYDKTVIILNGGTSKTLSEHLNTVTSLGVKTGIFNEPDLFFGMTAFCFLADERIWDREKYPDRLPEEKSSRSGLQIVNAVYREFNMDAFKASIGGENNFQLKEFLSKLRLA